jgi:hypothetical protein
VKRTSKRISGVTLLAFVLANASSGAQLKTETVKRWQQYVDEKTVATKPSPDTPFLLTDGDGDFWSELRSGKTLVAPAGPNIPRRIPSGLVHDWIGTIFIPNATITQVLAAVRDYDRYKNIYRPGVVDSKLTETTEQEDHFSLLLMNKSMFLKKAVEGQYQASYFRIDDQHWYSIAESTRVQEIVGYGGANQQLLPEGEGTGLIWRVRSITRYEQRDGGVFIQLEAMVLSRDVPSALRWMVDPIVRRVSRDSVQISLEQTRDAVITNLAHAESASVQRTRTE